MPLYLRKSSTFPEVSPEERGSAAGGEAARSVSATSMKHSFTANRQAKPEEVFYRATEINSAKIDETPVFIGFRVISGS